MHKVGSLTSLSAITKTREGKEVQRQWSVEVGSETALHSITCQWSVRLSVRTDRISEGVHERGDEGEGTKEERREG